MIYSKKFDELITAPADTLRARYFANLSNPVPFSNLAELPNEKGIYFIYHCGLEAGPIYIGSAHTGKRTLRIRCGQYVQKGSGGESVRGRLGKLLGLSDDEAIQYVRDNLSIRYIAMASSQKNHIVQFEQAAIWACQPVLNYILDKFEYGELAGYIR